MMNDSLLIELLTEELPPKSLRTMGQSFGQALFAGLAQLELLGASSHLQVFATPRRLAALISDVHQRAANRTVREKILPVAIAFDAAGHATAPLKKKLAALGIAEIALDSLERAQDGKAVSLFLTREVAGAALVDIMSTLLDSVVSRLPVAKLMNYQIAQGTPHERTVRFARPAHGLVVLHGSNVVASEVLGLRAGRASLGHRFLCDQPVELANANSYEARLADAFVIASFEKRREKIQDELTSHGDGALVIAPESLLDEVTGLVEWPVIYPAHFDDAFLAVPQECLILTMQQNQKYFALTDAAGQMSSRFLLVSNLVTDQPEQIIHGNERVLRARLSDAKFFFEQDKKRTLESRLAALEQIVYFKKLGSLAQRVQRIEVLAGELATLTNQDRALVKRAARLAKADLVTDMVGEFPELQGLMGRYYAMHDGESAQVADAIGEHYRPRFATDLLPQSAIGRCVALADKSEALAGLFAVGEIPTGERDPYALRRQALGVLRMLIDGSIRLELRPWLAKAVGLFAERIAAPRDVASVVDELTQFFLERLRGLLKERGYAANEIEAVVGLKPDRLDQVLAYLEAVRVFAALPEAPSLASANKRIANLLKKNPIGPHTLDPALLQPGAEQQLGFALASIKPSADALFAAEDYTAMLKALASLRAPVDDFFDEVMVMAEDPLLRANRLALLFELHQMMNRFADLSTLAGS